MIFLDLPLWFWIVSGLLWLAFAVLLGMFIHAGMSGPEEDDGRYD